MTQHRNAILNGDCLDILPQIQAGSVDFALTDPPYCVRYRSRDGRTVPNDDNDAWHTAGFRIVGHFVFPKRYTSSEKYLRYQHECAYLLAKGYPRQPSSTIGDVIDWTYSGNKLHPTQKPMSALLPLIETFSKPGGLVLDPFAGSGSTLVAARMLNRPYLGIELDAGYYALASQRLDAP